MPTKEEIEKVTKAGTTAPTGMGMQSPLIVVVKNKTLRDELAKMNAEVLGTTSDPFYNAPVIIVVLAPKLRNTYMNNGSLVIGNMLNAGRASRHGRVPLVLVLVGFIVLRRSLKVNVARLCLTSGASAKTLKVLVMLHSDMQLWSQNLQSLAKWAMCASLNNI